MVHPVPSDIRTAGETPNWKKVIRLNRGAAGGILGNKIFQTFFFFSKRSEAEREYSSHASQTSLKLIQFFGGGLRRSVREAGDRSKGKVTKMHGGALHTRALAST